MVQGIRPKVYKLPEYSGGCSCRGEDAASEIHVGVLNIYLNDLNQQLQDIFKRIH